MLTCELPVTCTRPSFDIIPISSTMSMVLQHLRRAWLPAWQAFYEFARHQQPLQNAKFPMAYSYVSLMTFAMNWAMIATACNLVNCHILGWPYTDLWECCSAVALGSDMEVMVYIYCSVKGLKCKHLLQLNTTNYGVVLTSWCNSHETEKQRTLKPQRGECT